MGKPRGPAYRWFHTRWATRLVGCLIAAALVCLLSACGGGGGSEGEGESFPHASDEEGPPPVDADAVDPMPSTSDDDGPPPEVLTSLIACRLRAMTMDSPP